MLTWIRKRRHVRPVAVAARARLGVESLEERFVPAAPPLPAPLDPAAALVATVFVETNNPHPAQNAVLAFHRSADGTRTPIGRLGTPGTSQLNLPQAIGPADSTH